MRNLFTKLPRSVVAAMTVLVVCLATVSMAYAARVFLNGVDVSNTNINNRQFDNIDRVLIDNNGDVHIVAPRYDIRVANAGPGQAPRDAGAMAKVIGEPYLALFVNENEGAIPYDITLKINGQTVRRFESDEGTDAINVSGFVKFGDNRVEIIAERSGRSSGTSGDANIRLLVGPGSMEGRRASVRHIRASMELTADQDDRRIVNTQEFEIDVSDDDDDSPSGD
jgi:hypothetical protein